jgi:hypothetical protein
MEEWDAKQHAAAEEAERQREEVRPARPQGPTYMYFKTLHTTHRIKTVIRAAAKAERQREEVRQADARPPGP